MIQHESLAWWMAFAHITGISQVRKMDIVIHWIHGQNLTVEQTLKFLLEQTAGSFVLAEKEKEAVERMIESIREYQVLFKYLSEQSIFVIPVVDERYPILLKKMQKKQSPLVLYVKGCPEYLNRQTCGVEGIRDTSELSLRFTDIVVQGAVARKEIIVAGFVNPVEKRALNYCLSIGGTSFVLLAEGILRFNKPEYDRYLENRQLSLVSFMHPRAEELLRITMDRNSLFYDFCQLVFITQSSAIGGGWEGALASIRKRPIYVRVAAPYEENFNDLLIQKGGIAVDQYGYPGNFEQIKAYFAETYPRIPRLDCQQPQTTSDYIYILRQRMEQGESVNLIDFFKEMTLLTDRMKRQIEHVMQESPDIQKMRIANRTYYAFRHKMPRQGALF